MPKDEKQSNENLSYLISASYTTIDFIRIRKTDLIDCHYMRQSVSKLRIQIMDFSAIL